MTKFLGLTGGIASGKTTISNYFKTLNIPVIDADVIAHDVMKAGTPAAHKIAQVFGEDIIQKNGEIDRKRLGEIVFASTEKREQLNEIVHGTIRKEILKQKRSLAAENPQLVVLDIPLLYEANYEQEVDEVMVVYIDQETQKERLLFRNPELSEENALNRIQAQMSLDKKAKKADIVIDNTASIQESIDQVKNWLQANFPELIKNE